MSRLNSPRPDYLRILEPNCLDPRLPEEQQIPRILRRVRRLAPPILSRRTTGLHFSSFAGTISNVAVRPVISNNRRMDEGGEKIVSVPLT